VNPARSLGPALIVGGTALSQVWLFIVAPLVGGAIAAGVHWLIFPPTPGSVDTGQAELAEEAADRRTA
jgi:aquaporin Z